MILEEWLWVNNELLVEVRTEYKPKARRCDAAGLSVLTLILHVCLEGELQLVTNDAPASVRELRMQKLSCRRSKDIGRYA